MCFRFELCQIQIVRGVTPDSKFSVSSLMAGPTTDGREAVATSRRKKILGARAFIVRLLCVRIPVGGLIILNDLNVRSSNLNLTLLDLPT